MTFDTLPLVEFFIRDDVPLEDALAAIETEHDPSRDDSEEVDHSSTQVWNLEDSEDGSIDDPFSPLQAQLRPDPHLDIAALTKLPKREVLMTTLESPFIDPGLHEDTPKLVRLFKVMDDSVMLCVGECGHVYLSDEYHQVCLEQNSKPFLSKSS